MTINGWADSKDVIKARSEMIKLFIKMNTHNKSRKDKKIDLGYIDGGIGIPVCKRCWKPMENYVPDKGRFKGQVQKNSWTCKCTPNLVLNIG